MSQLKPRHAGPHPGIVAIVYVVLSVTTIILWHSRNQGADIQRLMSFLLFGSAVPLGIFTAAVTNRINNYGLRADGARIALFGGTTASIMISLSACCSWVLSEVGADPSAAHALDRLAFVFGGAGHVVPLGLLMAGISVSCLFARYTPRWVAWLGLIFGALAVLSAFSLLWYPATIFLPLGRFGSFIWMIGIGFTLDKKSVTYGRDSHV